MKTFYLSAASCLTFLSVTAAASTCFDSPTCGLGDPAQTNGALCEDNDSSGSCGGASEAMCDGQTVVEGVCIGLNNPNPDPWAQSCVGIMSIPCGTTTTYPCVWNEATSSCGADYNAGQVGGDCFVTVCDADT